MDKDYSIYKYYKGSEDYPNDKARFFGFYEQHFDVGYNGKPEDKEEAFKDYMSNVLFEQCADMCCFGMPGVDKWAKYDDYLNEYFNPERNIEKYRKAP
ncbi:MAG TPA: hypothetical protein PKA78_07335 [Macellibacteroides fermentans]|uniref:hypothetical protein n=1 Tax=Macellibacteroides fermentans TaxID=879969 RepID=UPI002BEF1690|nr:hypothetical protein [Macellibacteroides fermentans]